MSKIGAGFRRCFVPPRQSASSVPSNVGALHVGCAWQWQKTKVHDDCKLVRRGVCASAPILVWVDTGARPPMIASKIPGGVQRGNPQPGGAGKGRRRRALMSSSRMKCILNVCMRQSGADVFTHLLARVLFSWQRALPANSGRNPEGQRCSDGCGGQARRSSSSEAATVLPLISGLMSNSSNVTVGRST